MRDTAKENGVSVKAYAGTTGVLLGMNVEPPKRDGLLGFAIERWDSYSGKTKWLDNRLHFKGEPHKPGQLRPTHEAPIQKFRWSDYSVYPDTEYRYRIHPVYGRPEQREVDDGPEAVVRTAGLKGEHAVLFNRAAASSQAFSHRFGSWEKRREEAKKAGQETPHLPDEALRWLSRGVLEEIVGFIRQATDPSWALDIAIYEYELEEIVEAVNTVANERRANVRVVYHAKKGDDNGGDKQTLENEHNLARLPTGAKQARLTSNICHHKFMVLSKLEGSVRRPQAVLCGSTNFTHNGVFRQANVVHVVRRPDVAQRYLDLFEVLFKGEDVGATRRYIDETNPFGSPQPLIVGFSPRSGLKDLQAFIKEVKAAKRDVLFCTAFELYNDLEEALLGEENDPILRYGVENKPSEIIGMSRDRSEQFTAAALLPKGLEDWLAEGWLEESTHGQRGSQLIHTKIILVDFTSDAPVVISGSHNLSEAASKGNDENYLILRGNTDVADRYGCELMRIYDYYRFRSFLKKQPDSKPPALEPNDSWTERYFEAGSLEESDRLRFSGARA